MSTSRQCYDFHLLSTVGVQTRGPPRNAKINFGGESDDLNSASFNLQLIQPPARILGREQFTWKRVSRTQLRSNNTNEIKKCRKSLATVSNTSISSEYVESSKCTVNSGHYYFTCCERTQQTTAPRASHLKIFESENSQQTSLHFICLRNERNA